MVPAISCGQEFPVGTRDDVIEGVCSKLPTEDTRLIQDEIDVGKSLSPSLTTSNLRLVVAD